MLATVETRSGDGHPAGTVTWGEGQRASEMAIADLRDGFAAWRLWGRMGWNDILQRYRRSLLGPFWLTASTAIMVVALGFLYAELFKTPIRNFLPFLCTGLLVWNLLATFLSEGGIIFTAAESYIKQVRLPYSIYVYRSSWSKIIIFAHNFVIYFGVVTYFGIWPGATALLAIPGLILLVLNGTLATIYIGILSARFRDIPPLINSVVQLIFFVTPIMWKPELLHRRVYIADINPFFHLIEIVRTPLLGNVPDLKNYLAALLITAINLGLAGLVFTRFRSRIAYWI
ncbi:ABC transporter permease [Bradyrhizobium liaoningense]|uniref:ABC transporter permease n=1 Tax=Bradyrhizobium liaoningense TaxID=43992 RepID=UPI002012D2D0|nr:ABC transporter permease [Bradyrhizobium liaoningense]